MSHNQQNTNIALFLGGARSGKSEAAEKFVLGSGKSPVYLATAEIGDAEMSKRIDSHKKRRGNIWQTIEAPLQLIDPLAKVKENQIVLLDCLTLWLSNVMLGKLDLDVEIKNLLAALQCCMAPVVCVSNEVGMGLVPETPLGREFRDAHGLLNQKVAEISGLVVFVAAGLPLLLKGSLPEVIK